MLIDVSELKHVHTELFYSQLKYSSLFENAYSIMMIIDPETKNIIEVNKAAVDYYGYPLERLKKMNLTEITLASEKHLEETISQVMRFKKNQFIRKHKLADGRKRFVEVFSSPIFIDGKNFLFSIIHDINERILNEEKLKKLIKAIEQSPVSAVITNRDGIIEYVNPKFCQITGYEYDEIIGKNPRILKSGEHSIGYYRKLWSTITSGKNWYGEFKNRRKDGSFYWELASVSPMFDENGSITHFIAMKEDISERKLKEAELQSAKEMAEESSRLKSNFLANMSHELRTPLVGILGYADILSSELPKNEYRDMADTILHSGHQLIETLNSILDLSRIESNINEIEIQRLDLKDVLNESYSLFKSVAKNKNLYFKMDLLPDNLYVDSDKHLLIKIFNNLINNALKFTSNGGITITSSVFRENKEYFVKTEIADTGIGIPKKYQGVIFEPFRQASEGLSRNYSGTGLGLTLTKKFVDLVKGKITVSSKEGFGSTFTVVLPFSKTEVDTFAETESELIPGSLKLNYKPSVLLVEDDIVNAQIIHAYLDQYFDVEHLLDGQIAINKCNTKDYDLILMDIALKGISGTSAMLEIKKLSNHYAKIPIIAITAFAMLGDKESFLKAGFSHYISKPFTRAKLFDILYQIFTDKSN